MIRVGWGAGGDWQAPSTGSTFGCEKILGEGESGETQQYYFSTVGGSLETTASTFAVPPEPGTLFIEVPAFPCTPVSNLQHLHNNVIALPAAFP